MVSAAALAAAPGAVQDAKHTPPPQQVLIAQMKPSAQSLVAVHVDPQLLVSPQARVFSAVVRQREMRPDAASPRRYLRDQQSRRPRPSSGGCPCLSTLTPLCP